MREIKFRAWDGEKMTDTIRLEFAHGLRLISTSDLGFGMIGDDKCILMQFTGLKDKNGKEIYEGDIVRTINNTEYGELNIDEEVYFSGGAFYPISTQPQETWEVIGNIYVKKEIDSLLEVRDRFYDTIVASPEWKAWYKEMMRRMREANKTMNYKGCYDIDESQECGVISKGHWAEFIKFIKAQK